MNDDAKQRVAWVVIGLMAVLSLVVVVSRCATERTPLEYEYIGVSDQASCSWDIIHPDRGTCIDAGIQYRCIASREPERERPHGRSEPGKVVVQCAKPTTTQKIIDKLTR